MQTDSSNTVLISVLCVVWEVNAGLMTTGLLPVTATAFAGFGLYLWQTGSAPPRKERYWIAAL